MERPCDLYGHSWGRGSAPGVLVCCRQRCRAQAVCVVCVGGMVPRGYEQAYCPMHQPRPLVRAMRQRKQSKPLQGATTSVVQEGLWSRMGG